MSSSSNSSNAAAHLPVLEAAPVFSLRKQVEPAPELGGSVVVVGLMASEAFAIQALKSQATRRVAAMIKQRGESQEHQQQQAPSQTVELEFDEWQTFGRYVPELLARAVRGKGDVSLYSADEWEVVGQHHPGLMSRLQAVAEELSGLSAEVREKNSSGQS